jgi:hypothetical protein
MSDLEHRRSVFQKSCGRDNASPTRFRKRERAIAGFVRAARTKSLTNCAQTKSYDSLLIMVHVNS